MFNTIDIHYTTGMTFGKVLECLLFYGRINLYTSNGSLPEILKMSTPEELFELKSRGLHLYMDTDNYGALQKNKGYQIMLIDLQNEELYDRNVEISIKRWLGETASSGKIRRKILQMKNLLNPYKRKAEALQELTNSVLRSGFYKKILLYELEQIGLADAYFANQIKYDFRTDNNLYYLETNLNLPLINSKFRDGYKGMSLSPDNFLLKLVSTFSDMMLSADNNAELLTSTLSSVIMSEKIGEMIFKAQRDLDAIEQFEKIVQPRSRSISTILDCKEKSVRDFIKLLDASDRFKQWKNEISSERDFIEEYFAAISKENEWINKLPIKFLRFIICQLPGLLPGVGIPIGVGLSTFDTFFMEKFISNKWTPKQFVDNHLKPFMR